MEEMSDIDEPNVVQSNGGCLLSVKVLPGSKREELRGVHDQALKIAVTQVAEKGKANKAVLAFLAKKLKISKNQLEIVSGQTDSRKTVRVESLAKEELLSRLLK